jgi:type IV pilus assembly protein PilB
MYISNESLRTYLLEAGIVTKQVFDAALKESERGAKTVSDILTADGNVGEDEMRQIYAKILCIPFISLTKLKVPYTILSVIPEPLARRNNIIAYSLKGTDLEVAMLNTDDLASIDFIKKTTRYKILPRLTDVQSIKTALKQYQASLSNDLGDIIRKETKDLHESPDVTDEAKAAESVPSVRIVDTLLRHSISQNASDIHIEPQENSLLIRYRIDGILHDAMELPKTTISAITARIKVLSNMKLDEKRLPQDGRFSIEGGGEKVSLRVSVLPTYYGEKIVMRLLRDGASGLSIEALGFHGKGLERIHRGTRASTGMILVTGPTGSGKSTTLYTFLDVVNTPQVNISTVEDPVEYNMVRVNQSQVRPEIGFTFAAGLRSLLRQDPDIIMVGEIRDKETASLAINAALTGHQVFSTLHTNSAAGAVPRLIDMGAETFLLVSTLNVVVGQRLVRKLCSSKEEYALSEDEMKELQRVANMDVVFAALVEEKIIEPKATWKDVRFYKAVPNDECAEGYAGRIGIHEVFEINTAIREMVMKGATSLELEAQARKDGMLTMLEDGIFKAAQGLTSLEEVLRVVSE